MFLSSWTWLYTYRRDFWKFWCSVIPLLTLLIGLIKASILLYRQHGIGLTQSLGINIPHMLVTLNIVGFFFWFWAIIVDTSVKSRDWYENYPIG